MNLMCLRSRALAFAQELGLNVEPAELPAAIPTLLLREEGTILYRPGEGEERAILVGAAFVMLTREHADTRWPAVQSLVDTLLAEMAA